MVTLPRREERLRDLLRSVRDDYDYIFIDCPPSLGLLTLNALVAADAVLIPLHCEYFALEGLADLVGTMRRVRAALNPGLDIEGVLLTMFDERTNLGQQVATDVRQFFKEKVFRTVIPRNVRLGEAPSHGHAGDSLRREIARRRSLPRARARSARTIRSHGCITASTTKARRARRRAKKTEPYSSSSCVLRDLRVFVVRVLTWKNVPRSAKVSAR